MTLIAVCQLKGGAGRSTIATNLAVGLEANLVDADPPQYSAAAWGAVRGVEVTAVNNHRELVDRVPLLGICVVDCPPRAAEMTRAALALADLVLIPVTPGIGDVWAVQDMMPIIREAQQLDPDLIVRIVWNRYRPHVGSELELVAEASRDLGIKPCRAVLGYRAAYPKAFLEGLSVLETADPKARDEMASLVAEVERLIR
jgi:chromosome partitioning protein